MDSVYSPRGPGVVLPLGDRRFSFEGVTLSVSVSGVAQTDWEVEGRSGLVLAEKMNGPSIHVRNMQVRCLELAGLGTGQVLFYFKDASLRINYSVRSLVSFVENSPRQRARIVDQTRHHHCLHSGFSGKAIICHVWDGECVYCEEAWLWVGQVIQAGGERPSGH